MFRLFNKSRVADGSGLLTSQLFNEASFYRAFLRDVQSAKTYVVIESPFLTEKRALYFAGSFAKLARSGVKVRVNTRNPRHHEKLLEIQSWKAIRVLRDHGVKVYFFNDMRHRKLAIIDEQILWEGSLNIISQGFSKEVMRRTDSAVLARQMAAFTKINNWF
jgi:Phosphatidylserine/phosphatidylglycerophosphate/cardiolipin synthases and related enzymes